MNDKKLRVSISYELLGFLMSLYKDERDANGGYPENIEQDYSDFFKSATRAQRKYKNVVKEERTRRIMTDAKRATLPEMERKDYE